MASRQELINIVNSQIIDNTTNEVTPAKVRSVFYEIINSMPISGDTQSISTEFPIFLDQFTGVLSILTPEFPIVEGLGNFQWVGKGYQWQEVEGELKRVGNVQNYPEKGAIFWGQNSDGKWWLGRWNGSEENGGFQNVINMSLGFNANMPLPGEPDYEEI